MKLSELPLIRLLGSRTFTLVCLILAMVLVVAGTLAQVKMGTFVAQKIFFNSFILWRDFGGISIPVFPGGLTVGLLWIVNLSASFILRVDTYLKRPGLMVAHIGILVLIVGQVVTQLFSEETMMPIEVGQSSDYSESRAEQELVIAEKMPDGGEKVLAIPVSVLQSTKHINNEKLPFTISVERFFRNSRLNPVRGNEPGAASEGLGKDRQIFRLPDSLSDEEPNSAAAVVNIKTNGQSLGTWLVSAELSSAQTLAADNRTFSMLLRAKRKYFPFSLTLKKFTHDVYPGTSIPRNFSSLVHIDNPATGESREALIYMNHPLRYGGHAFYQASYGKNDTLSIFQVVRNPGWLIPYLSCLLVSIGMIMEFFRHFFSQNRSQEAG